MTAQPPRSQQISTWLFNVIFSISILKHLVTAVYLAAQILIFALTDTAQRRAARVYAINSVIVIYALLLALHLASPIKYIASWKRRQQKDKPIVKPSHHGSILMLLRLPLNLFAKATRHFSSLRFLWTITSGSPCGCSLLVPLSQAIDASPSPLAGLDVQPLVVLFVMPCSLCSRSPDWNARYIPYIHYNFVTSLENLVAKTVIQLSSIVASWRHVANLELSSRCQGRLPSAAALMHMKNKRLLKLYWICSIGWALVLLGSVIGAFKPSCPPVCAARASPLWSRKCQCTYAHVNCHTLGLPGDWGVDSLLRADELGSGLLVLQVSRCDLSKGLTTATLNQFQSLFFLAIKFTNISTWDATMPSSPSFIVVSYGQLTHVPRALHNSLPSGVSTLWLANHPITSIQVPPAWQIINRLYLVILSLSILPRLDTLDLHYVYYSSPKQFHSPCTDRLRREVP
ncbi:hypothetical protein AeMF1_013414 [Aphanomyces euteiches]|nr:hypothetical protein AeMF1_013414 [Aphanomyces euteiches]